MADYRLYFLDGDGRIRHVIELDCRDDEHAVQTVQANVSNAEMELWQGPRKIRRFDADRDTG